VSVAAGRTELLQGTYSLRAHGSRQIEFAWSPGAAGRATLSVQVGSGPVQWIPVAVAGTPRAEVRTLTGDSLPLPGVLPVTLLIGLAVLGGTWVVARRAVGYE
jgi:hypothetical protein